jgi:GMP synthase-like glutamine amidotransferase
MMANPLPLTMGDAPLVLLLDLLAERAEFGHGGNLEIVRPMAAASGGVEVWLLTPQFQSQQSGRLASLKAERGKPHELDEHDVPRWDHDFPFWSEHVEVLEEGEVHLRRVALPDADDAELENWLLSAEVDAVVCTGSRRNVSVWEPWMDGAAALMRAAVGTGIPTLGICFGHQLLNVALGGKVSRAESRTDVVEDLELTDAGSSDELFTGMEAPVGLFTHQDHVVALPDMTPECSCVLLASAQHNELAAFRVHRASGPLPVWGIQFHPEAAKHRIARSLLLGHISPEEAEAFEREHDGAAILANFADVVLSVRERKPL